MTFLARDSSYSSDVRNSESVIFFFNYDPSMIPVIFYRISHRLWLEKLMWFSLTLALQSLGSWSQSATVYVAVSPGRLVSPSIQL